MEKSAESVTPNHPDKICDRISDAILDACLEQDPMSRVAIETMGGHGIITITGELTTKAYVNVHDIVRKIVGEKYGIQTNIVQQSPEIANGVDTGGAGDQGVMVGYACNDNEQMIPQQVWLARNLCQTIYSKFPFDGKTQITLDEKGNIKAIVASFQNTTKRELEEVINAWLENIGQMHRGIITHCNAAGDWKIGGFEADTGLTGRKLAVDNYGTDIPFGGGAFSGKDATKVDRSAAYMARSIAVKLLKEYGAKEVLVKLAYAIGVANPVMAFATVTSPTKKEMVNVLTIELTDEKKYLTPNGIIEFLDLRRPQFEKTAQWGHFGNGFKWDQ